MYRTIDFDEVLASQLSDYEFRKEYLLTLMEGDEEDSMEVHEALIHVAKKMGVTEFSELVKMNRVAVSRFISLGSRPKVSTLEKMLKPFGLKIRLTVEEAS